MPWDDDRLAAVEAEAQACTTGDACTADVLALVTEVRRLRGLLAQAERIILKRYLITGGLHADLVANLRATLGLPEELTDEDRALVAGVIACSRPPDRR